MNRTDHKVCVIAGATKHLGAAIARRLAAAGAAGIVVTGRNEDRGAAVAEGIAATSRVPTLFVRGDLGSVEDCRRMIAEADKRFGHVNVLVNAGASIGRGTILDTTSDLFDRMFAINVRGPYFLMHEAIKLMIRDSVEGAICNIGSISALAGQPFINPYCASRGALATLTSNIAFSVMRNRIRATQLNVGWMASDNERQLQAAESGEPTSFRPAHRSEEAARAVNFLVSDDAGLMPGAIVNFDTGEVTQPAGRSVSPSPCAIGRPPRTDRWRPKGIEPGKPQ